MRSKNTYSQPSNAASVGGLLERCTVAALAEAHEAIDRPRPAAASACASFPAHRSAIEADPKSDFRRAEESRTRPGLLGIKPMSQDVAQLRTGDVKMLKRIQGTRRKKSISVSRCAGRPIFDGFLDTIPESLPISTMSANDARHRGGTHLCEGDFCGRARVGMRH